MTASKLFSIDLKLDSKTQTALVSISKSLETIAKNTTHPSNVDSDRPNIPTDEPTELSVCIPDDLIEKPADRTKRKSWSKYGLDGWDTVPGSRILRWKIDGELIRLKYNESYATTSWDEVERLSKVPKVRRRLEIQRTLNTSTLDSVTAVNVFVSGYIKGAVCQPSEQEEVKEDLDAAFRPVVTPYINTRPMEECGSIESLQGAY